MAGTFHPLPAPDRTDLEDIASDVAIRTLNWLRRRELLVDDSDADDSAEQRDRSALSACLVASLGLGELTALPQHEKAVLGAKPAPKDPPLRGCRLKPKSLDQGKRSVLRLAPARVTKPSGLVSVRASLRLNC